MPQITNYLTVDVEDYFQVSAFEDIVNPRDWDTMEQRVVGNTERVLALLAAYRISATFFIVGWIAEKNPQLVRAIQQQGHTIAAHSFWHRRVYNLSPEDFRADAQQCKLLLESITNQPVLGYRAPSYSISNKSLWALDILKELGFQYDSSIFPVYHDTYGIPHSPRFPYRHPNGLLEYPLSTWRFLALTIPIAGGGYFRLFPYWFTRAAFKSINYKERMPFIFYFHPWEIDPNQPRVKNASLLSSFRHYNQIDKTEYRLKRLFEDFLFAPLPQE